jgi:branched-chain amino acid transport system substrate-binding protein
MHSINRRELVKSAAALAAAASLGVSRKARAQSGTPIKLGLTTPLSGSQQDIGNYVRAGAELAVAHINADGGIMGRPVELEIRDDKVNPQVATTVARELIAAGVNLQLGGIGSGPTLALGPVMSQEGGVHLTCGAGTDKINHQNYNPNVLRPGLGPYMIGHAAAKLLSENYGDVLGWGGIVPDAEYGRTTWAIFVDGLVTAYPEVTGKKPEIKDPVLAPYGGSDFHSQINAAMRLNTPGLFNSVYGGDAVTMVQQARPFGLFSRAKVFYDVSADLIVAQALKQQTVPYWTTTHWYHGALTDNKMSERLYKDYVAKTHNANPLGWLGEGYNAVYAYKAAIEKAKATDTPAVLAAFKDLTWDSPTGARTMRGEDNQAICPLVQLRVEPAQNSDGYAVTQTKKYDGAGLIEPPTPGKALVLKTA